MPPKKPTPDPTPAEGLASTIESGLTKSGGAGRVKAIGNALDQAMIGIPPERARQLYSYTQAVIEPLLEHADGIPEDNVPAILTYQELVTVLLSAAWIVQKSRVLKQTVA